LSKTTERQQSLAMIWILLCIVLLVLALAYGLRRAVCLRRKDCCGKGCGCLFPLKRE